MNRLAAAMAISVAAPAAAETIEFEADSDARFIRCIESVGGGYASCEMILPEGLMFSCVALDESGEPIAAAETLGTMTSVNFRDVDPTTIAHVACRRTG